MSDSNQAPILAAFAPSKSARGPVEFGIAASRLTGAPLMMVTVRPGGPVADRAAGGPVDDSMGDDARSIENLERDLQRRKVDAKVVVRNSRTVGGGLIEAIEELKPALVVLGATTRGGASSALLGSTIERVVHEAACPVAVVQADYRRPDEGVQIVGAAYSPTDEGRDALAAAAALARAGSVRLRAIAVLDPKHADDSAPGAMAEQHHSADPADAEHAQERMRGAADLRKALDEVATGVDSEVDILYNDPAEGLAAASRHVDLLVMGSRAKGPRRAVVFGSVSRKVAERSECPVLIIPRDTAELAGSLISRVRATPA
jgi:nucleotide-binding universal stress UspA family protein